MTQELDLPLHSDLLFQSVPTDIYGISLHRESLNRMIEEEWFPKSKEYIGNLSIHLWGEPIEFTRDLGFKFERDVRIPGKIKEVLGEQSYHKVRFGVYQDSGDILVTLKQEHRNFGISIRLELDPDTLTGCEIYNFPSLKNVAPADQKETCILAAVILSHFAQDLRDKRRERFLQTH